MNVNDLKEKFTERFDDLTDDVNIDKGQLVVKVPLNRLEEVIAVLKDDEVFDFDLFMDMTVVDWVDRSPRFDLVYFLYSVQHNHRIRVICGINDSESAPSFTKMWPVADWLEREMWDLYGIKFSGHPNLKRILLYEGFKGHPLRKDYPYRKRQPRIPSTSPSRDSQVQYPDLKIHR